MTHRRRRGVQWYKPKFILEAHYKPKFILEAHYKPKTRSMLSSSSFCMRVGKSLGSQKCLGRMVHNFPSGLPRFYPGIYEIVDDPSLDPIISWSKSNKSFVIWDLEKLLSSRVLSKFHCTDYSWLLTLLKNYGFKRIKKSKHLEFGHKEFFVRGKPELLKAMHGKTVMRRRKDRIKQVKAIEKQVKAKEQVEKRLQNLPI